MTQIALIERSASQSTVSVLRFLDLSAELRNHIYDVAADDCHKDFEFLHLTQTCRQIRTEFRPLYMENPLTIKGAKFFSYLNAFLPGWDSVEVNKSEFSEYLIIEDYQNRLMNAWPLLPLIRPIVEAPQVCIDRLDSSCEEEETLGNTLIWSPRKAWAKLVANGVVEDVAFVLSKQNGELPYTIPDRLQILLSKDFTAPWLKDARIIDKDGAFAFIEELSFETHTLWIWLGLQVQADGVATSYQTVGSAW